MKLIFKKRIYINISIHSELVTYGGHVTGVCVENIVGGTGLQRTTDRLRIYLTVVIRRHQVVPVLQREDTNKSR